MASNSVESAIKKVRSKGTFQRVFGWIIAIFNGFIAIVGCASSGLKEANDVSMVLFFSVMTAVGIYMIIKGNKKFRLIRTFYDYSARLVADPEKSIDFLASAAGVSVEIVTKNINEMLAAGFFPNCYIDGQRNKLVVPAMMLSQGSNAFISVSDAATQTVKYITVQCRGCGATNKIISGTVGECEYCGSQISE